MFTTRDVEARQAEFDEEVCDIVKQAGFANVRAERKMGITEAQFALIQDEFKRGDGGVTPETYRASCPSYTVTTDQGTFCIACLTPSFAVLDLTAIEKPLDSLGEPLADRLYPLEETLEPLLLLLS